jgi:hypothetical protein
MATAVVLTLKMNRNNCMRAMEGGEVRSGVPRHGSRAYPGLTRPEGSCPKRLKLLILTEIEKNTYYTCFYSSLRLYEFVFVFFYPQLNLLIFISWTVLESFLAISKEISAKKTPLNFLE